MTTATPSSTSSTSNTTAPASTETATEQPLFVPMTTKVRRVVGLNTDTDVALLKNDSVRFGTAAVIGGAINPLIGVAIGVYAIGASVRDRNAVKLARNIQVTTAPADNA